MRFLTVLAVCAWAASAIPATAQLGSFKKPAPTKPAPPPATLPKPARAAPAPVVPVSKPATTPVPPRPARQPAATATARATKKPAKLAPVAAPPSPVLQAADYSLFEQAALCRTDPRAILSRMRPAGSNQSITVYNLNGLSVRVNGWPADFVVYIARHQPTGSNEHIMLTVVRAPVSQVHSFARALPNMALGQIEQGDLISGTADYATFTSRNLPTVGPFTHYHTVAMMNWQMLQRPREISAVTVDSDSTAIIACTQHADAAPALGLAPSMLGPVTRVAAVPLDSTITTGSWRIAKSAKDGCRKLYSQADTFAALDGAIQQENWGSVVTQLQAMQCQSDLTYFLLGRSMEAMGYNDAAVAFYREAAKYRGGTLSFGTQCKISRGMQSCHGINVANETDFALIRLLMAPPSNLGPYPLRQPS